MTRRPRSDGKFSERLYMERVEQMKTQEQLARLVPVSTRTYQEWETGRRVPHLGPTFEALCETLRVKSRWLLFGEGEKHAQH